MNRNRNREKRTSIYSGLRDRVGVVHSSNNARTKPSANLSHGY